MFNIFGKKKDKKKKSGQAMTKEEAIAQALKNQRKAIKEIGEENIQKMADALKKEQAKLNPAASTPKPAFDETETLSSKGIKARDEIRKMDKDVIIDHIRSIRDEEG